MKNNGTLKYRVKQLELSVKEIDGKVDMILQNHLPHIENKLTKLSWLAGVNVVAIIIGIMLARLL